VEIAVEIVQFMALSVCISTTTSSLLKCIHRAVTKHCVDLSAIRTLKIFTQSKLMQLSCREGRHRGRETERQRERV